MKLKKAGVSVKFQFHVLEDEMLKKKLKIKKILRKVFFET